MVGFPHGFGDNLEERYFCAVRLHAMVSNHLNQFDEPPFRSPDLKYARLMRLRSMVPFYEQATAEFSHQLLGLSIEKDFGVERIRIKNWYLERSLPARDFPSSDVPDNHWAAIAVSELRALELLHGEPNGRFRGQ